MRNGTAYVAYSFMKPVYVIPRVEDRNADGYTLVVHTAVLVSDVEISQIEAVAFVDQGYLLDGRRTFPTLPPRDTSSNFGSAHKDSAKTLPSLPQALTELLVIS